MNWSPCPVGANCLDNFSCAGATEPTDFNCFARRVTDAEANVIFDFMSTLEITGIPQVGIKSDQFSEIICKVDPDAVLQTAPDADDVLPNTIEKLATVGVDGEYIDGSGRTIFAANDSGNFTTDIKQIFSPDTVSCCQPAGTILPANSDPDLCCTGFINPRNNACALPDFTNLSVFYNRYVSSGAKELNDNLFDSDTGFLNSANTVEQLACQQNICASNTIARGVALSNLKVEGKEDSQIKFRRFIDGSTNANNFNGLADLWDEGLRWNNNVYCVPEDLDPDSEDLSVIQCVQ